MTNPQHQEACCVSQNIVLDYEIGVVAESKKWIIDLQWNVQDSLVTMCRCSRMQCDSLHILPTRIDKITAAINWRKLITRLKKECPSRARNYNTTARAGKPASIPSDLGPSTTTYRPPCGQLQDCVEQNFPWIDHSGGIVRFQSIPMFVIILLISCTSNYQEPLRISWMYFYWDPRHLILEKYACWITTALCHRRSRGLLQVRMSEGCPKMGFHMSKCDSGNQLVLVYRREVTYPSVHVDYTASLSLTLTSVSSPTDLREHVYTNLLSYFTRTICFM